MTSLCIPDLTGEILLDKFIFDQLVDFTWYVEISRSCRRNPIKATMMLTGYGYPEQGYASVWLWLSSTRSIIEEYDEISIRFLSIESDDCEGDVSLFADEASVERSENEILRELANAKFVLHR